ncbi:MAG: hypothetical protein WD716_05580 [Fimbriimonadaceae bacterium]
MTLIPGYTRASLQSARDELALLMTKVVEEENDWEILTGERNIRRKALRPRMVQFRKLVAGLMPDSSYARVLPDTPLADAAFPRWETAMVQFAGLWEMIEADPPPGVPVPLLVAGGYGLADFVSDANALRSVYTGLIEEENDFVGALFDRDRVWNDARSRLVQYRGVVAASFELSHPLVRSLPRLSQPYKKRAKAVVTPPDA